LYGKLSNDRITRWSLLLEEYGPKYVNIAGKNNIVADALSRLEKDEDEKLSETEEGLVLSVGMGIPFCNLYNLVFCLIVKVKKRFL
jgi:hypothetical protein